MSLEAGDPIPSVVLICPGLNQVAGFRRLDEEGSAQSSSDSSVMFAGLVYDHHRDYLDAESLTDCFFKANEYPSRQLLWRGPVSDVAFSDSGDFVHLQTKLERVENELELTVNWPYDDVTEQLSRNFGALADSGGYLNLKSGVDVPYWRLPSFSVRHAATLPDELGLDEEVMTSFVAPHSDEFVWIDLARSWSFGDAITVGNIDYFDTTGLRATRVFETEQATLDFAAQVPIVEVVINGEDWTPDDRHVLPTDGDLRVGWAVSDRRFKLTGISGAGFWFFPYQGEHRVPEGEVVLPYELLVNTPGETLGDDRSHQLRFEFSTCEDYLGARALDEQNCLRLSRSMPFYWDFEPEDR